MVSSEVTATSAALQKASSEWAEQVLWGFDLETRSTMHLAELKKRGGRGGAGWRMGAPAAAGDVREGTSVHLFQAGVSESNHEK